MPVSSNCAWFGRSVRHSQYDRPSNAKRSGLAKSVTIHHSYLDPEGSKSHDAIRLSQASERRVRFKVPDIDRPTPIINAARNRTGSPDGLQGGSQTGRLLGKSWIVSSPVERA
jgi:hypothetical protein